MDGWNCNPGVSALIGLANLVPLIVIQLNLRLQKLSYCFLKHSQKFTTKQSSGANSVIMKPMKFEVGKERKREREGDSVGTASC